MLCFLLAAELDRYSTMVVVCEYNFVFMTFFELIMTLGCILYFPETAEMGGEFIGISFFMRNLG